jgi:hypothetical protein
MGHLRISARFVLSSVGDSLPTVAAIRAIVQGRSIRTEHALGQFHETSESPVAKLDVTLNNAQDLEPIRAALIARAARPEVVEAVIEWHNCGEDEPEPVHLEPWHPEYQEWRASRNCALREYGRHVSGEPRGKAAHG